MALLQSVSTGAKFTGLLRSSHALLAFFGLLCLLFSITGKDNTLILNGSFVMFLGLATFVGCRYLWKGPEHERAQPFMSFTQLETHLGNIEPSALEQPGLRELVLFAAANRRALPPPEGIILGSSSDPTAVKPLSDDEARDIAIHDEAAVNPELSTETRTKAT